jgi:hypothetical protein
MLIKEKQEGGKKKKTRRKKLALPSLIHGRICYNNTCTAFVNCDGLFLVY